MQDIHKKWFTTRTLEEEKQEQAMRANKGKDRWTMIDFPSLVPLIKVLEFGARKYSRDNWKNGFDHDELLDSLLRHTIALVRGETHDKESGLHHIGHILANAMFYSFHFYHDT